MVGRTRMTTALTREGHFGAERQDSVCRVRHVRGMMSAQGTMTILPLLCPPSTALSKG